MIDDTEAKRLKIITKVCTAQPGWVRKFYHTIMNGFPAPQERTGQTGQTEGDGQTGKVDSFNHREIFEAFTGAFEELFHGAESREEAELIGELCLRMMVKLGGFDWK